MQWPASDEESHGCGVLMASQNPPRAVPQLPVSGVHKRRARPPTPTSEQVYCGGHACAPSSAQSTKQARAPVPGNSAQVSPSSPQSASASHAMQWVGLRGTHNPVVAPAFTGLQYAVALPQSPACAQVRTHTLRLLPAYTARHIPDAQSASASQPPPSGGPASRAPWLLVVPPVDEDEDVAAGSSSHNPSVLQRWPLRHSLSPRQVLRQLLATHRRGDAHASPPQSGSVPPDVAVHPRPAPSHAAATTQVQRMRRSLRCRPRSDKRHPLPG